MQLKTTEASMHCLEGKHKVRIGARKTSRYLYEKAQKLFAIFDARLMTVALYRTIPPNNPWYLAYIAVSMKHHLNILKYVNLTPSNLCFKICMNQYF